LAANGHPQPGIPLTLEEVVDEIAEWIGEINQAKQPN
jgi:hypothetical protein